MTTFLWLLAAVQVAGMVWALNGIRKETDGFPRGTALAVAVFMVVFWPLYWLARHIGWYVQ